jgi:mannosyl-3-phosphoglycerate phosphatase
MVVFTDLDATLLDHETYSYAAANRALTWLKEQGIPLVLCSSKTLAEMQVLHGELGLSAPVVTENGAAVALPPSGPNDTWNIQATGAQHAGVLAVIRNLRQEYGYDFAGFSDWDVEGVVKHTGLPAERAALARQRNGTEPILWHDSEERFGAFEQAVEAAGLRIVAGGRFFHVMGRFDKADGMRQVLAGLKHEPHKNPLVVALGDSPNDAAMLNAADIAVVIQSPRAQQIQPTAAQVIRTTGEGSVGWQEAMDIIRKQSEH